MASIDSLIIRKKTRYPANNRNFLVDLFPELSNLQGELKIIEEIRLAFILPSYKSLTRMLIEAQEFIKMLNLATLSDFKILCIINAILLEKQIYLAKLLEELGKHPNNKLLLTLTKINAANAATLAALKNLTILIEKIQIMAAQLKSQIAAYNTEIRSLNKLKSEFENRINKHFTLLKNIIRNKSNNEISENEINSIIDSNSDTVSGIIEKINALISDKSPETNTMIDTIKQDSVAISKIEDMISNLESAKCDIENQLSILMCYGDPSSKLQSIMLTSSTPQDILYDDTYTSTSTQLASSLSELTHLLNIEPIHNTSLEHHETKAIKNTSTCDTKFIFGRIGITAVARLSVNDDTFYDQADDEPTTPVASNVLEHDTGELVLCDFKPGM
jgi:hypothetical protein